MRARIPLAVDLVLQAFNRYLGVAVGEHLGYLLTGAWTTIAGIALLDASAPLGALGILIGPALMLCSLEFVGRREGWTVAEGVHNVNRDRVRPPWLTFGTYTVRNVNTPGPRRALLTKRTSADAASSMPEVRSYSRLKAAMISRSNSITCSCISARARAASRARIASRR